VQLAYNTAKSEATGISPFFVNYRTDPNLVKSTLSNTNNTAATVKATEIRELYQELCKELSFINKKMAHYTNRQRVKGPPLKEGDAIYLLKRNIKTKQPSNKLDYKQLGPFKILQKLSDVSYKLDLPGTTKLHNHFHVSLLKPALLEVPL